VRISGSNAGYTMFRGSVKSTGYPLHSPVSSSLLFSCVTVCNCISTGVYVTVNTYGLHYEDQPVNDVVGNNCWYFENYKKHIIYWCLT